MSINECALAGHRMHYVQDVELPQPECYYCYIVRINMKKRPSRSKTRQEEEPTVQMPSYETYATEVTEP